MSNEEKRRFIRHPTQIPIEVSCMNKSICKCKRLSNISLGGLAFKSNQNWQLGTLIGIRIPLIDPLFETKGQVVWCQQSPAYFDVGVEVMDKDEVFKVRMVEQVCQIEQYRKSLKKQDGRNLSIEEAATEWISHYAADFSPIEREAVN